MKQLLPTSLLVLLGFLSVKTAIAQEPPRDQLDKQAGFVPNSQFHEIRESTETRQRREQALLLKSKNRRILTGLQRGADPEEIEKKLEEMHIQERELEEEFGPGHPKLKSLRHQIEITERHLREIADGRHDQRPQHEAERHVGQLQQKAHAIEMRMDEVRKELRNTKDDKERHELMLAMHALEKELVFVLAAMKSQHKPPHRSAEKDERMKQVHTLHEAAERLEANGLPDVAHELHSRAEQLERELHQQHDGPEAVIHEMMEELQRLRHEVRETHQKLDRILDLLEERDDHDDDDEEREGDVSSNSLVVPKTTVPVWWHKRHRKASEEFDMLMAWKSDVGTANLDSGVITNW